MKRKLIMFLLICLVLTWQVSAEDWDFDYNGVVDETESGSLSGDAIEKDKGYVLVSEGCWYDHSRRSFVTTAGGSKIFSSVASGMATCEEVTVKVSSGTTAFLYRDGNLIAEGSQFDVSEPGAYVLSVNADGMPMEPLKFTVLNTLTGLISQYRLPAGFYFDEVTLDGIDFLPNGNTVDLTREGDYRITYVCQATHVPYTLAVTTDHTPPTLALEAVVDGEAKGPVDISDVEPGAAVYVTRNGDPVSYSAVLQDSGRYEVTVVDPAGNMQTYNFTIRTYLNSGAVGFLAVLIVLLAGLSVYLLLSRRNLRVR